ncbi:kunitz-type serine protease inhibitor Vur-KIn-like [Tubulanus polymorphus]|uniref:kunitz-type serine protease inhibitor Vur-KIn-like n=1 Tax=Tubulanus polymorphus TaxID=672921 RepID=UPI003DA37644
MNNLSIGVICLWTIFAYSQCIELRPMECYLPAIKGVCMDVIFEFKTLRYFFNHETKNCEKFYFSGCKGNKNNFLAKELCEARCIYKTMIPEEPKDCERCAALLKQGSCIVKAE